MKVSERGTSFQIKVYEIGASVLFSVKMVYKRVRRWL